MATIAQDRMRMLQFVGASGVPPSIDMPLTGDSASASVVPGVIWKTASGLITPATAGDAKLVGFNDFKTGAATPTANTPLQMQMLLPNVFYEMSFETGAAAITRLGVTVRHVANATYGGTIGTSASATVCITPVAFFGGTLGSAFTYTVNKFIGQADTTVTAGQAMAGGITVKGTVGDTTPRLIVMFAAVACGLITA